MKSIITIIGKILFLLIPLIISLYALCDSRKATDIAKDATDIAKDATDIAKDVAEQTVLKPFTLDVRLDAIANIQYHTSKNFGLYLYPSFYNDSPQTGQITTFALIIYNVEPLAKVIKSVIF